MIRVNHIIYPTDFSSYATQAYFHAVGLAETYRAALTILHVYNPANNTSALTGPAAKEYWKRQLEQVRPSNTKIPVSHVFLEGDPATEIVGYAAEAGADVIVLGTHGRTGVDRLVMGSVAERVMREASCSVLVVKLPKQASPPSGKYRIVRPNTVAANS
jgi:nucleotide-binding universal stress UspA family protein